MSTAKLIVQICFSLLPFLALVVFLRKPVRRRKLHRRSVAVLVLGDIGRSPRMMYHSQSFARQDFETFVVGYSGSEPPKSLRSLPHVHFVYLWKVPKFLQNAPRVFFVVVGPLKAIIQSFSVLHALFWRLPYTAEYIIVQNPPSIPTLALVQLFTKIRKTKLIIDWHNLGYSILAMKLGNSHRFVRIAKWFERTFGQRAFAHLFVTKAMRDYLAEEWQLVGRKCVLHDRPPAHFHPSSPSEIHDLFVSFPNLQPSVKEFFPSSKRPSSTPFTQVASAATSTAFSMAAAASFTPEALPFLRADRPALVVSSTSWTEDEDFGILLEALKIYEHRAREINSKAGETSPRLPKMVMLVTGRGDLREEYMRKVVQLEREERWQWVRCRSVWMSAADYPTLLGSADLGVSLHSSSSAMDLPMKVVDMFGCGLPVCALDFACLDELVKEGVNGVVFRTSKELAGHFEKLLISFPESTELERLRASLRDYLSRTMNPHTPADRRWGSWDENWDRVVRPLILADVAHHELK